MEAPLTGGTLQKEKFNKIPIKGQNLWTAFKNYMNNKLHEQQVTRIG